MRNTKISLSLSHLRESEEVGAWKLNTDVSWSESKLVEGAWLHYPRLLYVFCQDEFEGYVQKI